MAVLNFVLTKWQVQLGQQNLQNSQRATGQFMAVLNFVTLALTMEPNHKCNLVNKVYKRAGLHVDVTSANVIFCKYGNLF